MFDKIFKIVALLILGFMAYTFYLYTLNTRYQIIGKGAGVFDRQTGKIYAPKAIRGNP